MSNYRNKLEAWLKTLEVKSERVLDVGGAALPVKDRVKSWDVQHYSILDNGLEPVKATVEITHDMNLPLPDGTETYDIVFCLELFEYIWNPNQAVVNLARLTEPDGTLYITFPFLYPVHEPKEFDSLRYTASGAGELLGQHGFVITKIVSRDMTPAGFAHYKEYMKAEGFHASKRSRHDQLGFIITAKKR